MSDDRKGVYLRAPEDLRDRLNAYAKRKGISGNAAALILLDMALSREEVRNEARKPRRRLKKSV